MKMIIWVERIYINKMFSQLLLILRQMICIKDKPYSLGTKLAGYIPFGFQLFLLVSLSITNKS